SIKLFKKAKLNPGALVLDAGCGIGGSSRLMAEQFNCQVTGIDLAQKFIEAADFLTQCTGLEKTAKFKQGSVLEMESADNYFDAVLCQHVLMNVKDKAAAIKEFFRVLKPGGKLILHEVTGGKNNIKLNFPVPWASKASISFLEPWEILANILGKQGFKTIIFSDESDAALAWNERVKKANKKRVFNARDLGPGLIFGENAHFFAKNMCRNLKENSVCLIETVLKKEQY
ncbi:MAG: class I SAM-dependent methyltransferase, partial [Desulfobacula sp.]|nr:class I SAM-dependent methyltransferase [Desulfobacula sp.]